MRIVTAGCELVYLELGDHREARLQSNGTGDVVNFSTCRIGGVPKKVTLTLKNRGKYGGCPIGTFGKHAKAIPNRPGDT